MRPNDTRIRSDDLFSRLPKLWKEAANLSTAAQEIRQGQDVEVREDRVKGKSELSLGRARRIGGKNLVAAREGGDHPEDRLAMISRPDELAASVDGDRPSDGSDVRAERERRLRHLRGSIETLSESIHVVCDSIRCHLGAAEQPEQLWIETAAAVLVEHPSDSEV